MNVFLWALQIVLALHTLAGAVWKYSNSEQTMPSLKALPHELWLAMIPFELLITLGLIVPAFNKRLAILVPIAAAGVAAEMLLFCAVHLSSGSANSGPLIYWLVVAAVCVFIVYGRLVLRPLNR